MDTSDIQRLLTIIEHQLDWGEAAAWQSKDFENLNQLIFEKTKVSLSASTLRRVWGKVAYNHLPSTTTLDTLAMFAGFENWRSFVKAKPLAQNDENPVLPTTPETADNAPNSKMLVVLAVIAAIGMAAYHFFDQPSDQVNNNDKYSFSSRRLTAGIPNSVVFNYDASASPTDSVFIQQSWDPTTKTLVSKKLRQHTSVYYEPGFYMAKLVVGGKIVKQHKLMIPTSGWLGLVENKPVPLYLKQPDFISSDILGLNVGSLVQKDSKIESNPTFVKYFNIGNFAPVPLTNFSYSVRVKNEYGEGSAACQFTSVALITDSGPIIIPLSVKGCSAELNMISVNLIISGKTVDLSGFGVDFSDWVLVSCKSNGHKIQYYINNKLIYQAEMPSFEVKIVGISFGFQGTGSVKNISLQSGGKAIFNQF